MNKYQDALNSLNPNYLGEQEYSWRRATEILQELVEMFYKENLMEWIESIDYAKEIFTKILSDKGVRVSLSDKEIEMIVHMANLSELRNTLDGMLTNIESDGSI